MPLWSALVALLVYWLLLRFGWSVRLRGWAERVTRKTWLQPALYALPFVVLTAVITLPWSIYTGFVREGQYGLMNLSFAGWLGDWAKDQAINLIVTGTLFLISAGFSAQQISPGLGLFGTIAGYVLGRRAGDTAKSDSTDDNHRGAP